MFVAVLKLIQRLTDAKSFASSMNTPSSSRGLSTNSTGVTTNDSQVSYKGIQFMDHGGLKAGLVSKNFE